MQRFERPLVRFAWTHCGDLETARDAVQDTFLKLLRQDRRLTEDVESLASWLFAVCRNRLIDLHRKNHRIELMDTLTLDETPAAECAPDHALLQQDDSAQIQQLIAELPPRQQEVIRLKFEAGLSYAEISAATGLTSGNVGYLIHQAVQSLRHSWAACSQ